MVNTVLNSMVDLSMANCECHHQMIRDGLVDFTHISLGTIL